MGRARARDWAFYSIRTWAQTWDRLKPNLFSEFSSLKKPKPKVWSPEPDPSPKKSGPTKVARFWSTYQNGKNIPNIPILVWKYTLWQHWARPTSTKNVISAQVTGLQFFWRRETSQIMFFAFSDALENRKATGYERFQDSNRCAYIGTGLPDFSWNNIPKWRKYNKWPQNIPHCYKIKITTTKSTKKVIKYIRIFHSKDFQNIPQGLVWKYTVWQPWWIRRQKDTGLARHTPSHMTNVRFCSMAWRRVVMPNVFTFETEDVGFKSPPDEIVH
jgi:hypothetical protein